MKREELEHELLVVRCQIGERDAIEDLIGLWHPRMSAYVGAMLTDRSHVEDVVQEIWMAILRSLPDLRDAGRFTPWAYTIARRSIADRLRSAYRHANETATPEFTGDLVSDDTDHGDAIGDRISIGSALAELAPVERETAWLALIEDRPLSEVAEITGVPVGTVKSRLHRARRELQHILRSKGYSR